MTICGIFVVVLTYFSSTKCQNSFPFFLTATGTAFLSYSPSHLTCHLLWAIAFMATLKVESVKNYYFIHSYILFWCDCFHHCMYWWKGVSRNMELGMQMIRYPLPVWFGPERSISWTLKLQPKSMIPLGAEIWIYSLLPWKHEWRFLCSPLYSQICNPESFSLSSSGGFWTGVSARLTHYTRKQTSEQFAGAFVSYEYQHWYKSGVSKEEAAGQKLCSRSFVKITYQDMLEKWITETISFCKFAHMFLCIPPFYTKF